MPSFGAWLASDPERSLGAAADVGAAVLLAWLITVCGLAVLAAVPGRLGAASARLARRLTPAVARGLLELLLGVGLSTAALPGAAAIAEPVQAGMVTTAPASAVATIPPALVPPAEPSGTVTLAPAVPVPAPTVAPPPVAPPPVAPPRTASLPRSLGAPARVSGAAGDHVVLAGDSLWDVARAELGPAAEDAAVARRWPAWYAANRAVIGADPDVLLPGQVLHHP